jgi:hypothetical protein
MHSGAGFDELMMTNLLPAVTSKTGLTKWYRLALAAFIAGSLTFHIKTLWQNRHHIAAGHGDFIIFYTGAQIVNDGKSKDLFSIETQRAYQQYYDIPKHEWPLPFNHPPYQLFIFLPLATLPFPLAHAIWSGINLLFLAAILRWLLSYLRSPHTLFVVTAVLAWFPTMSAFGYGQDSILTTALLLAVFVALKRDRDGLAGFLLALGLYKPQLVLPLAGALLVARRWNSVAAFTATGGALVAASLFMVGIDGAFDLVGILGSMGDYAYIINPRNMPNIRGLLNVALNRENLNFLLISGMVGISFALYGICLYFWRQRWDVTDSSFDLKFALVLVTTALVSFHLYSHDLFPLTLALGLLFRHVSAEPNVDPLLRKSFYPLVLIFLLPAIPAYAIEYQLFGWAALLLLFLYFILSRELLRRTRVLAAASKMDQPPVQGV